MPRELMIWTEQGAWFQRTEGGIVRSSFLGRHALYSVETFCKVRGLPLEVVFRNGQTVRYDFPAREARDLAA